MTGRVRAALCAAAATLVLAGCTTPPASPPIAGFPAPGIVDTSARPSAITIPAIDAYSTLIETGLNPDGTPQVPPLETPEQASWLTESPEPGELGPATIYGHVNGGGRPGVFARLAELTVGDTILVTRETSSTAVFTVDRVEVIPKAEFDDPASDARRRVYGDVARPELRLLTCGGDLERTATGGRYLDQVVVYAHLADFIDL